MAQQRSHVPKFGTWESGDNAPNYTVYFDKAREGRGGGKMINPNDPQENPDMFPITGSPTETRTELDQEPTPARNENTGRRTAGGGRGGGGTGRPVRQSAGPDHSIERSPLHPQHQAKVTEKGSASPGGEGRNSYDGSHVAPGKSRMKPANRADESPDRGAAVPKFGDWDENNPSSAESYTGIFNRVREERHNNGAGMASGVGTEPSYPTTRNQNADNGVKCCCFQWGSK